MFEGIPDSPAGYLEYLQEKARQHYNKELTAFEAAKDIPPLVIRATLFASSINFPP